MANRLAIVIVNYGSHNLIGENLNDPLISTSAEVVIVDNYTNAQELTALRALSSERGWHVVANPRNEGFGVGVNAGVAKAKALGCDAFLLLNPDVEIDVATIDALHQQVRENPVSVASPSIYDSNGKPWFLGGELRPKSGVVRTSRPVVLTDPFAWLTGACLVLNDEVWNRSGGFDPTYFLYWEDVDFSLRCRRAGAELVVRDDLRVVHEIGGTQKGAGKSPLYIYYNCRNRLVFASHWLPAKTQLAWIAKTPGESWRILRRAGSRRSLLRWDLLWATTSGSAAGISEVLRKLSRASTVRS